MGIVVKTGSTGQVLKFAKSLMYGFQYINNYFYSYVNSKLDELKYNGQLINLQKRLNDLFALDDANRNIYIVNSSSVSLTWIFRYAENNPIYVDRYTETSQLFIKRYSESVDNYDFIIYVPASLIYSDSLFDSIVNRYRLSDKNYTIKTYIP
jgi:hypothetical protein